MSVQTHDRNGRAGDIPSLIADSIVNALPLPAIVVAPDGRVSFANDAAEAFFEASRTVLQRNRLDNFVPFSSPMLALIDQVRDRLTPVHEYKVDLTTPRSAGSASRWVCVRATPSATRRRSHVTLRPMMKRLPGSSG